MTSEVDKKEGLRRRLSLVVLVNSLKKGTTCSIRVTDQRTGRLPRPPSASSWMLDAES